MIGRGHQEEGEAVGKWRRALLTSAPAVDVLRRLRRGDRARRATCADAHRDLSDRSVHDAMLAHGSPPPRHLRTLLGL